MAALQLIGEGRLGLDLPIAEVWPVVSALGLTMQEFMSEVESDLNRTR